MCVFVCVQWAAEDWWTIKSFLFLFILILKVWFTRNIALKAKHECLLKAVNVSSLMSLRTDGQVDPFGLCWALEVLIEKKQKKTAH